MPKDVLTSQRMVAGMSLEEKASLCSGADFWSTKSIERLGIHSFSLADGPNGLRKQSTAADHVGLNESVPATCFPTGSCLASSWDRELMNQVGRAIGAEARYNGVAVLLGPSINIKRSPLCGRNFEYLSEDPFLAGELATSYIKGVQSRGVGTSVKHFAANNQEKGRLWIDARVEERPLREIYLAGFERAVRQGHPWTVMCAYNRLNGPYCSQHRWLLTDVLRTDWGYDGVVVSDWGACDQRVEGLKAGLELEMPGNGGIGDAEIVDAVRTGRLEERVLDEAVSRLLALRGKLIAGGSSDAPAPDMAEHHRLAQRAARQGIVLLKNEGEMLPLAPAGKVAFIGEFARTPRFQGGGSSHLNPTQLDNAVACAKQMMGPAGELLFAPGYKPSSSEPDRELIAEAVGVARAVDVCVVFVGLTDYFESEGLDRTGISMPGSHIALLEAVASVQSRLVVVLCNGAPIEMPWIQKTRAVVEAHLGGQGGGQAIVDVLFGVANPSGKLAETFPMRIEDTPSYLNFPGDKTAVAYREGVFVGYRYYDAAAVTPLFPFGFGLSYTTFEYSGLKISKPEMLDTEDLEVSFTITNTGKRPGEEIVQVYVTDTQASVIRPPKELKGFEKVLLEPGEQRMVTVNLDRRAFAFWDERTHDWRVESGDFAILIGASSRDIQLRGVVRIRVAREPRRSWDRNTPLGDILDHPVVGKWAHAARRAFVRAHPDVQPGSAEALLVEAMSREIPVRSFVQMMRMMTFQELDALLGVLNGDTDPAAVQFLTAADERWI